MSCPSRSIRFLGAFIAIVFGGCTQGTLEGLEPSEGEGDQAAGFEPVSEEDAARIAERFVEQMAVEKLPQWQRASIGEAVRFDSGTDEPVFYEFAVRQGEEPMGYVTVHARTEGGVVRGFRGEGLARSQRLLEDLEGALSQPVSLEEARFLGGDSPVVGVEFPAELVQADVLDRISVETGVQVLEGEFGDVVVYSPVTMAPTWEEWRDTYAVVPTTMSLEDFEEEMVLRELYLRGDDEELATWFDGTPACVGTYDEQKAAAGVVGQGAGDFPNWSQPWFTWTNGTCRSGCTPLAAATALKYWEHHGWGKAMVNPNCCAYSSGTLAVLYTLRAGMGTYCSSGMGITPNGNNISSGIEYYLGGQGYGAWVSKDYVKGQDGKTLWYRIKHQIDQDRPILLHWAGNPGHSVMVYEYDNNHGRYNDWICYKNGDGTAYDCDLRYPNNWLRVTRITPH